MKPRIYLPAVFELVIRFLCNAKMWSRERYGESLRVPSACNGSSRPFHLHFNTALLKEVMGALVPPPMPDGLRSATLVNSKFASVRC